MKVVDLRIDSKTCTDNPMVKFLNVMNRGEDDEIQLVARKEDLPVGILKIVATKSGYEVVEITLEQTYYTAKLKKKSSR